MIKKSLVLFCCLFSLSQVFNPVKAAEYVYFGFDPQIVTNYLTVKNKMGYVRLTVKLMIEGPENLEAVEHHSPLLRDAIITIIGKQTEDQIKSIKGRAKILKQCEDKVKSLLTKETGKPLIKKLLFTQWIDE
jgi:flagellar FliL protein